MFKRLNVTIKPKTYPRLQTISKMHGLSMSQTIDILINLEYNHLKKNPKSRGEIIRERLDRMLEE